MRSTRWLSKPTTHYLLIVLAVLMQYAQTASFDYAYDDSIFITQSERVQNGWEELPALFENARTGKLEHKTGYRPLTLLSFATEVEFFGLNPKVSHVSNILLYLFLCLILYRMLGTCMPEKKMSAFMVAFLFAVHPLHVEVVANIKGRDELLAMLFGIMFLSVHLRYFQGLRHWGLLLAPVFFLFASLGKESAITFAGISVGLAFFYQGLAWRSRIYSILASILSLMCVLAMRLYVYSDQFFKNETVEMEKKGIYHWDGFIGNPLFDVSDPLITLANALNIVWHSAKLFVFPHPLVHDYSYDHFPVVDWTSISVYLGLIIAVGGIILIFRKLREGSLIALGLVWFFCSVSIYLSLVRPATDIFAERFLFTPSVGLCLMAIGVLTKLNWKPERQILVLGTWSLLLIGVSCNRVPAWKNTYTLLSTDIERLPDCVRANYNYSLYLHKLYDDFPEERTLALEQKILKHYNIALEKSERLSNLYLALGNAYMRFGQFDNGLRVFAEAATKYPHLAIPNVQIGNYYFETERYDLAIHYYSKALHIGIANPDNYLKVALAQHFSNDHNAAIETLISGEQYVNNYPEYYHKFVVICIEADELAMAQAATDRGLEKTPSDPQLLSFKEQFRAKQRQGFN